MNLLKSIWNALLRILGLGPADGGGGGDETSAADTSGGGDGRRKGKQRVAVLGGGTGSMAAVYGLTNEEGWQDKYDITVYQLGWRLGGKWGWERHHPR